MMKSTIFLARTMVLLLGLLMSVGCMGAYKSELCSLERSEVVLMSFHGRFVIAKSGGGGWLLKQETELSNCGWFTLRHLENDKVALETCHGKYVTAPNNGVTRQDWMLWQESELGNCGKFVLHELSDGIAFETCAGRYITAGDGSWPDELAWSLIGEAHDILAWESFTLLQKYPSHSNKSLIPIIDSE